MPASQCCSKCTGKPYYNITYGDGYQYYHYCRETVVIGPYSIPKYNVGASTAGNVLSTFGISGIAGLAWPALDSNATVPLTTALYNQNLIAGNLFGLYLSNTDGDSSSELSFGQADSNHYSGAITWITLLYQLWWTVAVASFTVGGSSAFVSNAIAVVDSGTSFLLGPPNAITFIINQFTKAGVSVVNYEG